MARYVDIISYLIPLLSAQDPPSSLGLPKFPQTCRGFWGFPHGTVMTQGSKVIAQSGLHHLCPLTPGHFLLPSDHCLQSFLPPHFHLPVVMLKLVPSDSME